MNKKGFTLAELLIVVAIISVLIAVSVPVFNTKTEASREATDIRNMRSAYSEAYASLLTDDNVDGYSFSSFTKSNPAYYDAESGTLTVIEPQAYGKGTSKEGGTEYSRCGDYSYDNGADYTDSVIIVYSDNLNVHVHWNNVDSTSTSQGGNSGNSGQSQNGNRSSGLSFNLSDYPSLESELPDETVVGNVYKYKGKLYVCLTQLKCGMYDPHTPENTGDWGFVELNDNAQILEDSGQSIHKNIYRGDLYKGSDGNYYIRRNDAEWWTDPVTSPSEIGGNWIKIN